MLMRKERAIELVLQHEEEHKTDASLARFLFSEYGEKTFDGWRCLISRHRVENKENQNTYDSKNDIYYTYLKTTGRLVAVSGEVHRGMMLDYSDSIGNGLTAAEVCAKHDFPTPWFREYRSIHGWSHSMLPITEEELENSTEEELIELMFKKKSSVTQKFELESQKRDKQDAEKWRNLQNSILKHINTLKVSNKAPKPALRANKNKRDYALVVSPTDFHYGMFGWEDETGEPYNLEEAETRLMEKTERLVEMLTHKPDKVIATVGSDWFHVDNHLGTTTKGTTQDMAGTPAQILMGGFDLARRHIELLRCIAPVELICMPGNHDRHSTLALMMYLQAAFNHCDDVSVIVDAKPRQYCYYGSTLIGFTHGDGKSLRTLPQIMATEQRKEWGEHRYHLWFHGHLHHRKSEERGGCMIIQMPSLSGEDRWHSLNGYVTNSAGLAAYIIDKEEGLVSSLFAPVA